MSGAFLEATELGLTLDGHAILRAVSLSIREGEFVSLIGPNGAGKTSLIKCLGRFLRPEKGFIHVAGKLLSDYGARELARLVGYVPQAEGRTIPFCVHDFVLLGRYPHLSPFTTIGAADRDAVEEALAVTGMTPLARRPMKTLSGGERQMAFIAAALAQGARLLLLDEPTAFLDYRHQAEVMRLLKRVNREKGITILAVHHDVNSAALWSDRIIALRGGETVFQDTPAALMRREELERIYDTRFELIPCASGNLPIARAEGAA